MTEDRLVPKPHLIKSMRSRNWTLTGAISELVDNSLGHGKATAVEIVIDNDNGIGVYDNGRGIDDINRVFALGDASAHDVLTEIGQYGVGATDATVYLGNETYVQTIHNDRLHEMTVNWVDVEKSGQWPLRYKGLGRKPGKNDKQGTEVIIYDLAHAYQLRSSQRLADDLGQLFAPALRRGTDIFVYHKQRGGAKQAIDVKAFSPPDLNNEKLISGHIKTHRGTLIWTGRAGLSPSLTERHNGVHIAFEHRIIEVTRDAFNGVSAPTLYCEITLDSKTPWKHALSDHKDKVVHFRDQLMVSINEQLADLLEESAEEAKYLALANMTAPIEMQLTAAMQAAGVLHVDDDEEGHHGEGSGDGGGGGGDKERGKREADEGDEAAPAKEQPTGIKIDWRTKEQLDGKLWSWDLRDRNMIIALDKEEFGATVGWPPKFRERHVVQLVAALLSHAIEKEWLLNEKGLNRIITRKLRKQIADWAEGQAQIAPYVNRAILEAVVS